MKKLLIGTKNPGKFSEISKFFAEIGIEAVSLADLPDMGEVEETGKTFFENALLKAKTYFERYKLPAIADDGGLEIDALHGEPGVKSRRWKDGVNEMTDQEIVDYTLDRLKGVPYHKRTARLVTEMVFYNGKKHISGQGFILGKMAELPIAKIEKGYPFRALFIVDYFNKPYASLTETEHEVINHRRDVLRRISGFIKMELENDKI